MRKLIGILIALVLVLIPVSAASADTYDDITLYATPEYVSISITPDSYNFTTVAASATPDTGIGNFTLTNGSTVEVDFTIAVTTNTWAGGVTWAHSDTCTVGEDQAGLKAGVDDDDDLFDVIVKYSDPNYLLEDYTGAGFDFSLELYAPDAFTDGVEKSIVVRVTAIP